MGSYHVQVAVPAKSGIASDAVVNTWCVSASYTSPQAGLEDFADNLKDFYEVNLSSRSTMYKWVNTRIKIYKTADPKPRVPVFDELLGLSDAQSNNTLPTELACCLSFQADKLSGAKQARRRGRVYLGPFGVNVVDQSEGRPTTAWIDATKTAALALLTASETNGHGWKWCVLSPTSGLDPDGGITCWPVTNGWLDNAIDVQRRRGLTPTARTMFERP